MWCAHVCKCMCASMQVCICVFWVCGGQARALKFLLVTLWFAPLYLFLDQELVCVFQVGCQPASLSDPLPLPISMVGLQVFEAISGLLGRTGTGTLVLMTV